MVDDLSPVVYPEVISQDILPGPVNPPPAGLDAPVVNLESEDNPAPDAFAAPASDRPQVMSQSTKPAPTTPPPTPISEPRPPEQQPMPHPPQQEPTPPHEPMPPPLSHGPSASESSVHYGDTVRVVKE